MPALRPGAADGAGGAGALPEAAEEEVSGAVSATPPVRLLCRLDRGGPPPPGSVGGFQCRVCGVALWVTLGNAEAAREPAKAVTLCSRCGFAVGRLDAQRAELPMQMTETARLQMLPDWRKRNDEFAAHRARTGERPQCDFCERRTDRLWLWRADPFQCWPQGAPQAIISPGPSLWGACVYCRPLFAGQDLEALVARVTTVVADAGGAAHYRTLWRALIAALVPGEPTEWTEGEEMPRP